MVKVASLFGQLLSHFPRLEFAALVKKHGAERGAKGFTCWTQLVSMLFCQLAKADSLREICNGLKCCMGKVVHLGIASAPNKSTLAYANEHRPAALYADLFYRSLEHFRDNGGIGQRRRAFRFKPMDSVSSWSCRVCNLDVTAGRSTIQGLCSMNISRPRCCRVWEWPFPQRNAQ